MASAKPKNIDAQRILAIMDELKEKLSFLSVVTPQVLEGLQGEEGQAACDSLGPDLVRQFAEQIRLEEMYVLASTQADGTFGHADDNEEAREDIKSLQKNTLELCRKMKTVPTIVQELRYFQETRPGAVIQFLKTLADMQELTLIRLTTTLEEEHSRAELLKHYVNREQEANTRKQQLEKDLNHIRRECERAQSQRTEILTKLRADLLDVRDSKAEKMSALRTKYENRMKDQHEAFTQREAELTKRINSLRESNKKAKGDNEQDEAGKKKTVRRYEMDVETQIKLYDSSVKQDAYMLSEHQELHKKELKQLEDLREHFEKVDAEKACIANEEAIVEARRQKLEAEKARKNAMAATVQAFWRGILMREFYAAEKKKRRKKGGGKKKK
eukprot:TRINITY_DN62809_c0_g1_i1.p1 TRINITY_DN62809_c0_g1~~TRINITY_DN62809_c0_g1_i1.p1  ORF type:complete len:419 (-),score=152.69 TRINITY_DN62809_c0_g1_i1:37-1194(-)